jgi:ankyrin repeat protein
MTRTVHKTLIEAAVKGDVADIATHIANGANPNAIYEAEPGKYVSTLTLTASAGPALAVRALLAGGAVPDGDPRGGSPLEAAINKGREDVVAVLLEFGADPNRKNEKGDTPLHMAAHLEHQVIYRQLVACGADENAKGRRGFTPLQVNAFIAVSGAARRY